MSGKDVPSSDRLEHLKTALHNHLEKSRTKHLFLVSCLSSADVYEHIRQVVREFLQSDEASAAVRDNVSGLVSHAS